MENLYIYQEVQFHARLRDTTRGWKKHRRGKTRGKEVAQVARGRGRVQVQNSVLEIIRQGRERRQRSETRATSLLLVGKSSRG